MQELLRLQWENRNNGDGMLDAHFRANAVLVGIGGPTHLFLPEAAKALGAESFIPAFAATANAVGAVAGRMTAVMTADVRYTAYFDTDADNEGSYRVMASGVEPRRFKTEEAAIEWVEQTLREMTGRRLREQGAVGGLQYKIEHHAAMAGDLKVSTQIIVTATA